VGTPFIEGEISSSALEKALSEIFSDLENGDCIVTRSTVGIGMGQVNRVDSARLALTRAGERTQGSVAASDAFFPFADGLEILLNGGVRAVVQPGGSIRDEEVIALAQSRGITMYFTGARHFTH
jgi:phosphoribosylaminoimidazolecarboxamide formyltransferase/IMP cyclohydrolase